MYPILLIASVAIFLTVVVVYVRQDFSSVYHPISFYLMFHGLVFAIRPLFAYWNGYEALYRAYDFLPSPATKATVIVAANLGLLAFVAAAWRSGGVPLSFGQSATERAYRASLIPAFLLAAALLAPIAIQSLITVYGGGYAGMRLDAHTGVAINTTGNGWLYEAQLMLVPLAVLFAWTFRFRLWSLAPLALFFALRAGTGGRGPIIVACVAAALLWLFDRGRRWPTPRMFALGLAILAVFYAVGQERGAVRTYIEEGRIIEFRDPSGFMESMDWANLEFFEYVVEAVPRKTGTYGYFVDNLQVFTEPVPRKLWPGKPVGPPIRMFNLFDYGNPIGMTYSLPGYGWAQLGYLGVIGWCALWGWALGAIYSAFATSRQGNLEVAAYFAFLPIFVIAFRDGMVLTVLKTGVFYLTPVLAWMLAARLLGIPFHAPLAHLSRRVGLPTPPPAPPRPRRRRTPQTAEIVPRAWRGRERTPQAE
ncbi:MAG: O-antigen polysaccharide polymerase Wzy [Novosphingobium sp.]|nr:O-antigen polysaccharide polymerase Wzy [Novosphingobium sp.]